MVWVDALCIDQNDNYEKVYQLRQMGTIFYQAAKVVAWLGPAADDSNKAMQALSHMPALSGPDMDKQLSADTAEQRNLYWRASRRESLRPYWHTKDDSSNTLQALSKMSELEDVDQHAHAILRLLLRPYWNRVWIIQEIARASRVEVWCGRQMLTWTVFTEGLERWVCWSHVCDASFGHPFVTLRRFREAERNSTKGTARMLLSTALVRTQYAQATLRRDKIYALLGITRDGTETVPTPNYVQDDATVFRNVLRHMVVNQAQLNLILVAGMHEAKE